MQDLAPGSRAEEEMDLERIASLLLPLSMSPCLRVVHEFNTGASVTRRAREAARVLLVF